MNPFLFIFMLSTIVVGTLIVLLSSHWFFVWLGLEINTLSFLPLLITPHNPRTTEATVKYFLVQALASALLLLGGLLNAIATSSWSVSTELQVVPSLLFIIAITLKMAVPPCHNWLPDVLQGLPLLTGLILSTWQKVAPFFILVVTRQSFPLWLILSLGLVATLIGGWGGINQTQIRKLLAFSSISHIGWIIVIVPFSPQLATLALIIYLSITSTLFLALHVSNTLNLTNLGNTLNFTPGIAITTLIISLSLAGLPPLTGFLSKWLIIQELALNNNILPILVLVAGNLLRLFYYTRITYIALFTLSPQHITTLISWRVPPSTSSLLLVILIVLRTATLFIAPSWLPLSF